MNKPTHFMAYIAIHQVTMQVLFIGQKEELDKFTRTTKYERSDYYLDHIPIPYPKEE